MEGRGRGGVGGKEDEERERTAKAGMKVEDRGMGRRQEGQRRRKQE